MLQREMSLLLIEMVRVEEDFCVWVLLILLAVVAAVGMSMGCGGFSSPLLTSMEWARIYIAADR